MRHLTGQNKAALARYDYAPYGELMRNAGLPLTVGYTGHHWDAAIGHYYAPFRYYNPQTARWNMRDPLGFVDGPNMYAYVKNAPIIYSDRLGLDRCIMRRYPSWKVWKILDEHWWIRVDTYDPQGNKNGEIDLHYAPPDSYYVQGEPDWYSRPTEHEPISYVIKKTKSNRLEDQELVDEWLNNLDTLPNGHEKPIRYQTGMCRWATGQYKNCGIRRTRPRCGRQ